MDRLETRELEYFVAVAEDLHFGRAAERLGIAQPPLSRAISRLERRLDTRLFDRTSRRVELTAAGEVFLSESRRLLKGLDGAVRRTREAVRVSRPALAVRPGSAAGLLTGLVRRADLDLVFTRDPAAALHDGTAQLAVLCAERDDITGLATTGLLREHPVVLLPRAHRLAEAQAVPVEVLRREPGFQERCPAIALDEVLDRVAVGLLVTVVGHGTASRLPPEVIARPVDGLPATTLLLAWDAAAHRPEIGSVVDAAKAAETDRS